MRLSTKAIQEFKEICREEFGIELSDDEAQLYATRLLELFWLLFVGSSPPVPHADNIHDDVDTAN